MFSLFHLRPDTNMAIRIPGDWNNISTGLVINLNKVVNYYRSHSYAVESNHLLVNLLMNLNIPLSMDIDRYYANAMDRSVDLARVLGFTSSVNRGKVFHNFLFGNDTSEFILSLDDEFDYEAADKDWRELSPIKLLRHPVTDLGMLIPNGKKGGSDFGISIASINIPLLAIQYRAFRNHEKELAKRIPDYNQRSVMQFIHMYPLANILPSLVDGVIANRVCNLTLGKPMGVAYRSHPFPIPKWEGRLNKFHGLLLNHLKNNRNNVTTVLRSVPMVTLPTLEDYWQLPDVAQTRQVMWLLLSARLPALIWTLFIIKSNKNSSDSGELNVLRKYFTRIKQNNQVITQLPAAFKETLTEELEEIYSLLEI